MRIISKFKDYYDGGQAGAHDDPLVFVRQPETYHLRREGRTDKWTCYASEWGHPGQSTEASAPSYVFALSEYAPRLVVKDEIGVREDLREHALKDRSLELYTVIVAGVVYRGIQMYSNPEQELRGYYVLRTPKFFWDAQSVLDLVGDYGNNYPKYIIKDPHLLRSTKEKRDKAIQKYFEPVHDQDLLNLCMENSIGVAMIEAWSNTRIVTINPTLRPIDFIKRMQPFEIFQELSMFVGNLASKDDTPVKIADKDRHAQHGFDKWSFRKKGPNSED